MEFFITKNLKKLIAITSLFLGISVNAATNDTDIKIVKVNDSNFEKEILFSDKLVILDITSTSCPPCLIMIPTLIDIAKKYPDIKVATVGIDEPNIEKIKNTLPIQAFPTFYLINKGTIVNRLIGVVKEKELLAALQYTPSKEILEAQKTKKQPKNTKKNLTCKVDGQFNGLKNKVTISFVFNDYDIKNVDIVTDVLIPKELESKRNELIERVRAGGKGEVTPTETGFKMHIDNDCRFMKAMDMKRTSTYGEMRAGLELQGFTCN